MMGYLPEGPRTWKWLVPALIAVSLVYWGGQLTVDGGQWTDLGTFMVVIGLLVGGAALVNLWRLVSEHRAEMFHMRREAEMLTPLVSLARSMKQMHPEAVRVLNRFGVKTSWGVKVDIERGERDWVLLDTDPSVHFGFVEYVLTHSKGTLVPMHWFSEGSKKWDPDGLAEDREQYQALRKWMYARMMITEAHGNQPPHFLPPWNGELVMEAMGLTGEQDLYKPDASSDGRRDLGDIPRSRSEMDKPMGTKVPEVPEEPKAQDGEALTEEEARALELVREQYPTMAVETYRRLKGKL